MKERPILFSTPMIKAILEGRKTMTRRLLKQQPLDIMPMNAPNEWVTLDTKEPTPHGKIIKCRFGVPGDCLWVRETWSYATDFGNSTDHIFYRASYKNGGIYDDVERWKPSIYMPRHASRITLEITNVRIERLQDITEEDAIKEGCAHTGLGVSADEIESAREQFEKLWDSINGKKYPWNSNPYVWVIEFQGREN